MSAATILVAGVGNIFLGDDGFGVEVVRQLAQRSMRADVRVQDFGIRGIDLAYALLAGYDLVLLVDVVERGSTPGTVYVIDLEDGATALQGRELDTHGMVPGQAIALAKSMGGRIPRLILVGCEPARVGDGAENVALSPAVHDAVEQAIAAIELLIERHTKLNPSCTSSA